MRTTVSIPDEFYNRIKLMLEKKGFMTLNDYLLDLLRHQIDADMDIKKIDYGGFSPSSSINLNPANNISISESLPTKEIPKEEAIPVLDDTQTPQDIEKNKISPIGLSGKTRTCPVCSEKVPVELIRKHYDSKHEGI